EVPVAAVDNSPLNARYSAEYGQAAGGVNMTALVTSSTAMVDISESRASTSVTTREMTTYVDRGKGMQAAFSAVAGVTQINGSQSRFQPGLISVTGQRPTSNYFTVNDLSANTGAAFDETSASGSVGAVPNLTAAGGTNSLQALDATGEVAIRTIPTAKDGRVAGATINFVSKSGTNEFHGSLFETFGNEAFDANDFFANSRGFSRSAARLNQFGGTLAGFLRKDKAWFFGNYEGLRLRQRAFSLTEVPSLASRQNAAENVRPLFEAFPVPNGRPTAGGFAEFAAAFTNPAAHDVFGLQIDAQPLDELRVGGKYNFFDSKASLRGSDNDFSLNTLRNLETRSSSLSLSASYVFSPSVVGDARVSFSRNRAGQNFSLDDFGGANVPSSTAAGAAAGVSPFGFLKYDLAGKNSALAISRPTETIIDQFQAKGSVDWIINNHTFSAGADFRRLSFDIGTQPVERSVLFSGVNLSGTTLRISELTRAQTRQGASLGNFSLYAQDEWRVSSKLNLTAGLRWDADFAPRLAAAENLNFQNASTRMRDNLKNFAPRVAFAFDPTGGGNIALRGSFGLYY
ncbi:MAG TPA: TonB-dependent receptor, partial [Pyrinomonadaceae bacterium]|nr:TonB-dependent receptor [Pyrinomonadaceae bacterium]